MTTFESLFEMAAKRKGGAAALEKLIQKPKSRAALAKIPDDRWLSEVTKCVFQAGFNWKVVERKWPQFEKAYQGFAPEHVAGHSDDDLDRLLKDRRVIRQWRKLKATRHNAQFLVDLANEHGSAARFFADYPSSDYVGLLKTLKTRGAWLGGTTAQYFLRSMGKDSFILSADVLKALRREEVYSGSPTTNSSQCDIQAAFNTWVADGGKSLTRVSRVLAFTVPA
ncbi:MAG: DNA-3-methyladenine glycosylase I [Pseudomonadota bacterium]